MSSGRGCVVGWRSERKEFRYFLYRGRSRRILLWSEKRLESCQDGVSEDYGRNRRSLWLCVMRCDDWL